MDSDAATTGVTCGVTFENDAESIAAAAIAKLTRDGKYDGKKAKKAIQELGIDPEKKNPAHA